MTDERYVEKGLMIFLSFLLCGFSVLFAYGWTHVQKFSKDETYTIKSNKSLLALNTQPATILLLEPAEYSVECFNYVIPGMIGFSSQLDGWTQSNPPPKCERLAAA